MNLEFNLNDVETTEFGVGRDDGDGYEFAFMPVDESVQIALREMVDVTWNAMRKDTEEPPQYQPSEKHAGIEHLYVAADNPMAARLIALHEASDLPTGALVLEDPEGIFGYFVRLVDDNGRRLTAVRRAGQFKGLLKKQNRLARIVDDTLKIVEEKVFRLDNDFDLIIDSDRLHIWRPSSFEFMGGLKQAILDAVPGNVDEMQKVVSFVDFSNIHHYASQHPRAARYLTSIREQNLTGIDHTALTELCRRTGLKIQNVDGMITVSEGDILGFLEVLDRRRYLDELDPNAPEPYRATSRQKIAG